jgi:predicted metal-dependent hydrolase
VPIAWLPDASIYLLEAERGRLLPGYTIRRSDRARRSRLTVTNDGSALVVLPVRAAASEAADLVARHAGWIERHQRRIRAQQLARAARPPLAMGREVLLRGEPHRVVSIAAIDGRNRASLEVGDGRIVLVTAALECRSTRTLLEAWLRAQARADIGRAVAARSAEMGIQLKRLTIRDQKTRWGSASARGTLSFSWRLVMCPPRVLDYVVVHELAHLMVAGHSQRFWRLVERHHRTVSAARKWLRDQHDELRHALD